MNVVYASTEHRVAAAREVREMNDLYNQVYRCRKCGKEFCPVTTHGRTATGKDMNEFVRRANGTSKYASERMALVPKLYAQHNCKNGDIGVADFIGYEKMAMKDET